MTEQTDINIHDYEWRCSCGEVGPPSYGTFLKWARSLAHRDHMKVLVNTQTGKVVAKSSSEARTKNIPLLKKEDMEKASQQRPAAEKQEGPPPVFPEGPAERTEQPQLQQSETPPKVADIMSGQEAPPGMVAVQEDEEELDDFSSFEPDEGAGEDEDTDDDQTQFITEYSVVADGVFRVELILPSDAFTLFNMAKAMGFEKDPDITFNEYVWDCIRERFRLGYKVELMLVKLPEEPKHGG